MGRRKASEQGKPKIKPANLDATEADVRSGLAKINPNMISQAFDKFRAMCITPDAGSVQVQEMKKAFFGGATIVLSVVARIGTPEVSEKLGMEILDALHNEIERFASRLKSN